MTTFSIDGPITEIVTAGPDIAIVALSCGEIALGATPTIIERVAPTTIGLASYTISGSAAAAGFALSPDFNIGDIVEVYYAEGSVSGFQIVDENGNNLAGIPRSSHVLSGVRLRKVLSGASTLNWGIVG